MKTDTIALPSPAPGATAALTVHRFGDAGARPKVYIQAALHADEIPGMIAAHRLRERLGELETQGRIAGEIVLVPVANPIGLGQRVLGHPVGRFDLSDGANFNRHYPDLVPAVAERLDGRLGPDAAENMRLVREGLGDALRASTPASPAEHLKHALLALALDADIVLDLHCDAEAVMHLYTLTPSAGTFAPLCALIGAQAVLLATDSGDHPFDEACSRPWHELRGRFPDSPIPLACQAATVELRGQADVSHDLAEKDAAAILGFLTIVGALSGEPPPLPEPLCVPTPLEASEPILAPAAGIVVYHCRPGERVEAGDAIAELVDPLTGTTTPAVTQSSGILYARADIRFAQAGRRLAKVAGTTFRRSGKLLSP